MGAESVKWYIMILLHIIIIIILTNRTITFYLCGLKKDILYKIFTYDSYIRDPILVIYLK